MDETEVLVVGAGPTGLTLAIDLAHRGIRTLLVERHERPPVVRHPRAHDEAIFARGEREANDELVVQGPLQGATYVVAKVSLGVLRDFRVTDHVKVGIGALYAVNFLPQPLGLLYGGGDPQGAMAFVRLNVN